MTNRDNKAPKRVDIYEEFVLWSAMPPRERGKLGIETQEEFVEFYNIGINTPTAWKRRPDYEARVTAIRHEWAFDRTGAVIEGIYLSALKGNPFSQKLWLQYFHGFTEKAEVNVANKVEITVNDIRFIIEALPEPLKSKHYGYLRDLLADSTAFADARNIDVTKLNDAGEVEDTGRPARPAEAVSEHASHGTQNPLRTRVDVRAARYETSVGSNTHHQSATLWRQEFAIKTALLQSPLGLGVQSPGPLPQR